MSDKDECMIPEDARTDPDSRELLRAWVANAGLHVSLFIPDEWEDPGHWGVALADVTRHLADAYNKSRGIDPKDTVKRIQAMIAAELSTERDDLSGGFVEH